jgi:glycosyltransferase involved in cell wall biosynthesis
MDTLILSPTPTWPQDLGSKKYIYDIGQRISAWSRVHFLLYAAEAEWRDLYDSEAEERCRSQWATFHIIPSTRPLHTASVGEDHELDEWWDPSIGDYLTWRFQRSQFNAFIVNYTWLSRALEYAPSPTFKLLQTIDVFSERRTMFESRGLNKEFFHLSAASEADAFRRADAIIAIKEEEAEVVSSMTDRCVFTVPFVNPDILCSRKKPRDGVLTLGFIAGNNTINVVNFLNFLDAAAPLFAKSLCPVEILVGGHICDELEGRNVPFVRFYGYVDDVSDFYENIDAAIAPIQFSTGLKIKFAEAVAAGVPILSTAHAAEGYACSHPWMECADVSDLIEVCIELAFQPSLLEGLAQASRDTHREAKARVATALTTLRHVVENGSPTNLIIAGGQLGDIEDARFCRLFDILNYARWNLHTSIALASDATISPRGLRKLRAVADVHILECDVAVLEKGQYASIMLLDVDQCVLKNAGGAMVIYDSQERVLDQGSDNLNCPLLNVSHNAPYFYRKFGRTERTWSHRESSDYCVHILAEVSSVDRALSLLECLTRLSPFVSYVVLVAEERDWLNQLGCNEAGFKLDLKPRLVIDLTGRTKVFGPVREIYQRCGIPVFYPMDASVGYQGGALLQERCDCIFGFDSWGQILQRVKDAFDVGDAFEPYGLAALAQKEYNFRNDAGWVGVWKCLSSIKELSMSGAFQNG